MEESMMHTSGENILQPILEVYLAYFDLGYDGQSLVGVYANPTDAYYALLGQNLAPLMTDAHIQRCVVGEAAALTCEFPPSDYEELRELREKMEYIESRSLSEQGWQRSIVYDELNGGR